MVPTTLFSSHRNKAPGNRAVSDPMRGSRLLLGLLFSVTIGLIAYRRRSLSRSGIAGAMVTGTTTFGMGGWSWGLSLIFFFVSSSIFSHFRARDKANTANDKFSKGSRRDFAQVAANGGVATLLALSYGLAHSRFLRKVCLTGYAGALSTATADTWATELGVLSLHQPRLITTGKAVAPGTSGGITPLGTAAAASGALAMGTVFWLLQRCQRSLAALPLIALVCGLAGSIVDSFLGATVQAMYYCPHCQKETERRVHSCGTKTQPLRGIAWLNNDAVNFIATLCGGLMAMTVQAGARLWSKAK
ncbi:MAG: DUF92 domain-containing protein [Chloroflexi bacterium]|nr:MAG: DUF92 domain-containing protein [Chloroflexota bacterium]